ncbi:MAG: hypothetical protein ACLR0I_06905 [Streptococcus salivarius]
MITTIKPVRIWLTLFRQQAMMPQQLSSIRWLSPRGALSFHLYVEAAEETGNHAFNQVPVPAFWEISGNNQMARVSNLTEERARITYLKVATYRQKCRMVGQVR